MASVGNSFKIATAVGNSVSTTGTLYTVPANSYAILNLFVINGSGTNTVTVGGQTVWSTTSGVTTFPVQIYAGPGQAVALSVGGSVTNCAISGVQFTNA